MPPWNQYEVEDKVSFSRTQCSAFGETGTNNRGPDQAVILIKQSTLPVSHKTPHLLLHVAWNEFGYFRSENLLLYPYPNAF